MTKLSKRIAALGGIVYFGTMCFAAGLPKNAAAKADEANANTWEQIPHINSWTWGSFDYTKNIFTAVPKYGKDKIRFTFTGGTLSDSFTVYAKAEAVGGEYTFTYSEVVSGSTTSEIPNLEQFLSGSLGTFGAGEYEMTVFVEGNTGYTDLTAATKFSVFKADNYWVQSPYLASWYEGEYGVSSSAGYPVPVGTPKCGESELTFAIYAAKNENNVSVPDLNLRYYYKTHTTEENELNFATEGWYFLIASVPETDNYSGISVQLPFRVFPSEEALAQLEEMRQKALEEFDRYVESLGIMLSDDVRDELREPIYNAKSTADIRLRLTDTKVSVYKQYAFRNLDSFIADYGLENLVPESWDTKKEAIRNAISLEEVDHAYQEAYRELYPEGVKVARHRAMGELRAYAQDWGVAENQLIDFLIDRIDAAEYIEDVQSELNYTKWYVADHLFNAAEQTNLARCRDTATEAIKRKADYYMIPYSNTPNDPIYAQIIKVGNAADRNAVEECYKDADAYMLSVVDAARERTRQHILDLSNAYSEKYPSVAEELSRIVAQRVENNFCDLSVAKTLGEVANVDKISVEDIERATLAPSREKALADLQAEIKIAGVLYDIRLFEESISTAQTVGEVEELLTDALNDISYSLWEKRSRAALELEEYAAGYYKAEYRDVLSTNLTEGKQAIYATIQSEQIAISLETAKISYLKLFAETELDDYSARYGDYQIESQIEAEKFTLNSLTSAALPKTAEGLVTYRTELESFLTASHTRIYNSIKNSATSLIFAYRENYPSYNVSPAQAAINAATDAEGVHTAFQTAKSEIDALVDTLNREKAAAKNFLTISAEEMGIGGSDALDGVLRKIDEAKSAEEMPQVYAEAKTMLEQAAKAEKARVDGINAGLIAGICIMGVLAAGLGGVLIFVLLKRKKPKNPKNPQAKPPVQPNPAQGQTAQAQHSAPPQNPVQPFGGEPQEQHPAPPQNPVQPFGSEPQEQHPVLPQNPSEQ